MKNISVRKIVLASIWLLASILLLAGLAFIVVGYDMGLGSAAEGAVNSALGTKASGFALLAFKFPSVLYSLMVGYYAKTNVLSLFSGISGALSVITLVVAVGGIVLSIVSFFCFKKGTGEKLTMLFLIVGLIFAVAYAVVGVVVTSLVQNAMKKTLESVDGTTQTTTAGFTTSMFVSAILQVLVFVAYIICSKKIREKAIVGGSVTVGNSAPAGTVSEKRETEAKNVNRDADVIGVIEEGTRIIGLLTEYKKLYDNNVLSSVEYIDKKVRLLRYSDKRMNAELASMLKQCSFGGIVNAEASMISMLKEYKKLFDAGVISESDFVERKAALLGCIIGD